jgi:hypothetical protein
LTGLSRNKYFINLIYHKDKKPFDKKQTIMIMTPTYIVKPFSVFEIGDKLFYTPSSYGYFSIYDGDKYLTKCSSSFFEEHFAWKLDDIRDLKIDQLLED